eukprot:scaffold6285_cov121-Isochrysis_galbana.AAC.2
MGRFEPTRGPFASGSRGCLSHRRSIQARWEAAGMVYSCTARGGSSRHQPRRSMSSRKHDRTGECCRVRRDPITMSFRLARVKATLSLRQSESRLPMAPWSLLRTIVSTRHSKSRPCPLSTVSASTPPSEGGSAERTSFSCARYGERKAICSGATPPTASQLNSCAVIAASAALYTLPLAVRTRSSCAGAASVSTKTTRCSGKRAHSSQSARRPSPRSREGPAAACSAHALAAAHAAGSSAFDTRRRSRASASRGMWSAALATATLPHRSCML